MKTRRGFFRAITAGIAAVATGGLAGCLRKPHSALTIDDLDEMIRLTAREHFNTPSVLLKHLERKTKGLKT